MTADDIYDALGLDRPTAAGPIAAPELVSEYAATAEPVAPPSPFALQQDGWSIRRGAELADALAAEITSGPGAEAATHPDAVADFHTAAFDPSPAPTTACADKTRQDFMTGLLDTPEYREMHSATRLNTLASEIATRAFAKKYADLAAEMERREAERKERAAKGLPAADATGLPDDLAAAAAAAGAAKAAAAEVEEHRELVAAAGMGPGAPGGPLDPATVLRWQRALAESRQLKQIMELAGRYRRAAQAAQRRKAAHGQDDVVGVELGADLGRLLPAELARLADDDLELDTLRRFAERSLQQREWHATEPVGRGPLIIVVDESGSMSGAPVVTAKALALAMAWVAGSQRRWCALVQYSGGQEPRQVVLPPGRWPQDAMIGWLSGFLGGGSNRDLPIEEMPEIYRECRAPAGKTDIVMITDAILRLDHRQIEDFRRWKAAVQARVTTLVIGGADLGSIADVSDVAHRCPTLALDEPAVAATLEL